MEKLIDLVRTCLKMKTFRSAAKLRSIPVFFWNSLCSCISDIEQSRNTSDVLYESYDIESVFIPPIDKSMETPSKKFKSDQFLDNYGSFLTGMRYGAVVSLPPLPGPLPQPFDQLSLNVLWLPRSQLQFNISSFILSYFRTTQIEKDLRRSRNLRSRGT